MCTWVEPLCQPFTDMSVIRFKPTDRGRHFVGRDVELDALRPHLEAFHGRQLHLPGWNLDTKLAGRMENPVARGADARVGVRRRVELAVGGREMDSGAARLPAVVDGPDREHSHGPLPSAIDDADEAIFAAVHFEQCQLRQTLTVVDVRNPFAVRRPARMECVVLKERQLIRLATGDRLNIQIRELICRSPCR